MELFYLFENFLFIRETIELTSCYLLLDQFSFSPSSYSAAIRSNNSIFESSTVMALSSFPFALRYLLWFSRLFTFEGFLKFYFFCCHSDLAPLFLRVFITASTTFNLNKTSSDDNTFPHLLCL